MLFIIYNIPQPSCKSHFNSLLSTYKASYTVFIEMVSTDFMNNPGREKKGVFQEHAHL